MTMMTLIGELLTAGGEAQTRSRRRVKSWSAPGTDARTATPTLMVDWCHDGIELGRIRALRRTEAGAVWALAELDLQLDPRSQPLYFSALVEHWPGDVLIHSAALTPKPAAIGIRPVVALPGGLDSRGTWVLDGLHAELAAQAVEHRHRPVRGPLPIRDAALERLLTRDTTAAERMAALEDQDWRGRPPGRYEYRPSRILRVS